MSSGAVRVDSCGVGVEVGEREALVARLNAAESALAIERGKSSAAADLVAEVRRLCVDSPSRAALSVLALGVFERAWKAAPDVMHALVCNRVPCGDALADDPTIICDPIPVLALSTVSKDYSIGVLGLVNGVLGALGLKSIGLRWASLAEGDELRRYAVGFEFIGEPVAYPAGGGASVASAGGGYGGGEGGGLVVEASEYGDVIAQAWDRSTLLAALRGLKRDNDRLTERLRLALAAGGRVGVQATAIADLQRAAFKEAAKRSEAEAKVAEWVKEAKRLAELVAVARCGLTAVFELIEASDGVKGLHDNGDDAPWSELQRGGRFDSWLGEFSVAFAEVVVGKTLMAAVASTKVEIKAAAAAASEGEGVTDARP